MPAKPERRIRLREFRAISSAISTYKDLDVLVSHIGEGICRSFDIRGCSIMLLEESDRQLHRVFSYGISEEYLNKGPLFLEEDSAFVTGQPSFVADVQNDPRIQYPEAAAKEGIVSLLSVPIKSRDATIGIIRLYHDEPWILHEDDLDSFYVLAAHLGLVIENNGLRNFLEGVKFSMGNLPPRMLKGL